MALFEGIAGTFRSTNTLEPARQLPGVTLPAFVDPEAVTRAYYLEERGQERRYFEDYRRQSLVMEADVNRIRSRREDLPTIRAMLAIAGARGWTEVKVAGSAQFRREAWIEARSRGLIVQGYRANGPEHQEAERRRAQRHRPSAPATNDLRHPASVLPHPDSLHRANPEERATAARKTTRPVGVADLSADGRLVFAALSVKIDRQMLKLHAEAKAELKAFAAAELAKKERAEGPVVLTAAQRAMARAPQATSSRSSSQTDLRQANTELPRRARGR